MGAFSFLEWSVFDFAVITPGKGAGIPNARSKLLSKMDVAEPNILGLQAT
jgi:hypothetical protein